MKQAVASLLVASLIASLAPSRAETQVPGTFTYYSYSQDPITDANTGYVAIDEVHDQEGTTGIIIRCANETEPLLWFYLYGKNQILTREEADAGVMPHAIVRLGSDAPVTVEPDRLGTVLNAKGEIQLDRVSFDTATTRKVVDGLLKDKRLVLRINRTSGGQPLTYTFPAKGFSTAWNAVKQCR